MQQHKVTTVAVSGERAGGGETWKWCEKMKKKKAAVKINEDGPYFC